MTDPPTPEPQVLQAFVLQLGAAMNAAGEPVYLVQERLRRVAHAYGARSTRVSAFPTFMMVTMGRGEPATLDSDLGPLAAAHLDGGLAPGDRALVIVRPEATRFERRDPDAPTGLPNHLAAELIDSVTIGPTLRLRAVTAGGAAFEAIAQRGIHPSSAPGLTPGDPVFVTFEAASARAYRDENIA